eukprot:jgi/Mesvir1/8815/Mv02716-RA.1
MLRSRKWDHVILQEQSVLPTLPMRQKQALFFPAVKNLAQQVRAVGAEPVLFMTWAWEHGVPEVGNSNFRTMAASLAGGLRVAPVGIAWKRALERNASLALWRDDGLHPSPLGSAIAAAVFYALLFGESPHHHDVNETSDKDGIADKGKTEGKDRSSDTLDKTDAARSNIARIRAHILAVAGARAAIQNYTHGGIRVMSIGDLEEEAEEARWRHLGFGHVAPWEARVAEEVAAEVVLGGGAQWSQLAPAHEVSDTVTADSVEEDAKGGEGGGVDGG